MHFFTYTHSFDFQTLNHVRSPYRFELVLPDTSVIGKRRLAQRIGGEVYQDLKALHLQGKSSDMSMEAIAFKLDNALKKLAAEDA